MGYRSDIKYIIDFPTGTQRDTFLNMVRIRGDKYELDVLEKDWDIPDDGRHILCSLDDWKWYDSFPQVQAHESLMDEAANEDEDKPIWDGSFLFLRIGENWDDNEERCGGKDVPWGTVLFNRSVDFDI